MGTARRPVETFLDVHPAAVSAAADVAALFGVAPDTVRGWVRAGKLPCLPRVGPRGRVRVLGSALLAMLGEQVRMLPGPTETKAERQKRAKADREEARRLAKTPRAA